jgi:hypothetical protein
MIFMTGGAFTPASRAFLNNVPNLRIEKPFDVLQLRALINDRVRYRRSRPPADGRARTATLFPCGHGLTY